MKDKRVVFFGTSEFAEPAIRELISSPDFELVGVVTLPDQKKDRGYTLQSTHIKKFADSLRLKVFQRSQLVSIYSNLLDLKPDFFVVACFGAIIPDSLLAIPRYGGVVIHPSLLPKYRGATPTQTAILEGEKESGVCIIKLARQVDAGPILLCEHYTITKDDDYRDLTSLLFKIGARLLLKALRELAEDQANAIFQDEHQATCCRKVHREDGMIFWELRDASSVDRQVRAFCEWPGCFTFWKKRRLKILSIEKIIEDISIESPGGSSGGNPGKVVRVSEGEIGIETRRGIVIPGDVQLEGGKRMKFSEFLNGHRDFLGSVVTTYP